MTIFTVDFRDGFFFYRFNLLIGIIELTFLLLTQSYLGACKPYRKPIKKESVSNCK